MREALKLLASEGLVEHVPYRGVRVVELSREDVEDLYATRALVEGRAARFAAQRISRAEVDELERLHEAMVACVTPRDLARYRELNRRFHTLIFEVSRRSHLVRTLAQMWAAFPTMLWSNIPRVAAGVGAGAGSAGHRRARGDRRRAARAQPRSRRARRPRPHRGGGRGAAGRHGAAAVTAASGGRCGVESRNRSRFGSYARTG